MNNSDFRYIVRRLAVWALIALCATIISGKARAGQCNDSYCTDIQTAIMTCENYRTSQQNQWGTSYAACQVSEDTTCPPFTTQNCFSGVYSSVYTYRPSIDKDVPAFTVYAPKTTCDSHSWKDPLVSGACLNRDKCLAKNVDGIGKESTTYATSEKSFCSNGCQFAVLGPLIQNKVGSSTHTTGAWGYTGEACGSSAPSTTPDDVKNAPPMTSPPRKPTPEPTCVPVGTQTACIKPNGDFCASGSNGKQFCWRPGETGKKTDGPDAQVKAPQQQTPDNLSLPNGDTASKTGPDMNLQTTDKSGNVSNSTISNYKTLSGNNAGPSDEASGFVDGTGNWQGKPGDWDGKDNDGEKNGSTGGTSCDDPPQSTGDALLGQIARQQWETRCNSEKADAGAKSAGDALDSQNDGVDDSPGAVFKPGDSQGITNALGVDQVSAGSSSCPSPPAFSIGSTDFKWPSNFCNIIALLRKLIIAGAYLAGAIMVLKR